MLTVWGASGDRVAEFPLEGLTDVKSLKQALCRLCGITRFRQRLVNIESGSSSCILADSYLLGSPVDVQLVVLPFRKPPFGRVRLPGLQLIHAIVKHNLSQIESILNRPQDPNVVVCKRTTPLLRASSLGYTAAVELLLEAAAEPNLPERSHNVTALREASYNGHEHIVSLLLKANANINLVDGHNWTALHAAALNGHASIARMLLQCRADSNACDAKSTTPLVLAVCGGHTTVAEELLRQKADVNFPDDDGWGPLLCAIAYGQQGTVPCLLNARADANLARKAGAETPAETLRLVLEAHDHRCHKRARLQSHPAPICPPEEPPVHLKVSMLMDMALAAANPVTAEKRQPGCFALLFERGTSSSSPV